MGRSVPLRSAGTFEDGSAPAVHQFPRGYPRSLPASNGDAATSTRRSGGSHQRVGLPGPPQQLRRGETPQRPEALQQQETGGPPRIHETEMTENALARVTKGYG